MKIVAWILTYFLGPSAPQWAEAALGAPPEPYALDDDMASWRRARADMKALARRKPWEPGPMRWVRA